MNISAIVEAMDSLDDRLEKLEEEQDTLRCSKEALEHLLEEVRSGKVELQ